MKRKELRKERAKRSFTPLIPNSDVDKKSFTLLYIRKPLNKSRKEAKRDVKSIVQRSALRAGMRRGMKQGYPKDTQ